MVLMISPNQTENQLIIRLKNWIKILIMVNLIKCCHDLTFEDWEKGQIGLFSFSLGWFYIRNTENRRNQLPGWQVWYLPLGSHLRGFEFRPLCGNAEHLSLCGTSCKMRYKTSNVDLRDL